MSEKIKCPMCGKECSVEQINPNPHGSEYSPVCAECAKQIDTEKVTNEMVEPFIKSFSKLSNRSFCTGVSGYLSKQELVKMFADTFCHEHRCLQGKMIVFVIDLLEEIGRHAGDPAYEDGRNDWALKMAQRAANGAMNFSHQ